MSVTHSIPPASPKLPSRLPLRPRIVTPSPQLRRKDSFIRKGESSEEYPSPHESIYDAAYFSSANSEDSGRRFPLVDTASRIPRPVKKNDENRREPSLSVIKPSPSIIESPPSIVDAVEFRYGNGTALETITEQKSYATMRSKRSRSADHSPAIPFLGHRDSFIVAKSPRRKISFSADDITLINQSYHEACATIEKQASGQQIYAEPQSPIHALPDRPSTPEGMPSWDEAQRAPRIPPTQQNIIRRFFNHPSISNRDRTVSSPVAGRTAPRFRPPRSVYGPIQQHPFTRAPIAKVEQQQEWSTLRVEKGRRLRKDQRVRFTPSATARDSEMLNLQSAIESTTASAIHPLQPSPVVTQAPFISFCPHRNISGLVTNAPEPSVRSRYATPSPRQEFSTPDRLDTPTRSSNLAITPQLSELDNLDGSCRTVGPSPNSTTPLMTGALVPGYIPILERGSLGKLGQIKEEWCWKCALQSGLEKIEETWGKALSCFCPGCCDDFYDGVLPYGDGIDRAVSSPGIEPGLHYPIGRAGPAPGSRFGSGLAQCLVRGYPPESVPGNSRLTTH